MPEVSTIIMFTIVIGAIAAFAWPRYQLSRAVDEPFPAVWRKALRKNFPVFRQMPTDLQLQLKDRIKQFIHEKEFIGCDGFEITDEVKVTVAASACLLLLNREGDVYGDLNYILIYPNAFLVKRAAVNTEGLAVEQRQGVLGESWSNGKVILSWEDVLKGNQHFNNGSNVAIHEFAHQLDHASGATNGAPFLGDAERSKRWSAVLMSEFKRLCQAAHQGEETLINQYGTTNPAEFFAVVTETFFGLPAQMEARHPALFTELRDYYKVDPGDWLA